MSAYPEGWQSWSPTTLYRPGDRPFGPANAHQRALGYRGNTPEPQVDVFQGDGLLAVDTGDETHVFAALETSVVPSIRISRADDIWAVHADGDVSHHQFTGGTIASALAAWAEPFVTRHAKCPPEQPPTVWCSWYQYYSNVTAEDIRENVAEIGRLDLNVEVVQIDDGYQREIGDWLAAGRFNVRALADHIRTAGHRVGLWLAPFLVGERSRVVAEHPEWLVRGADAGHNWGQQLHVLDITHPGAVDYLRTVLLTFADMGIDYFKLDFLYAGALDGERYRAVAGGTAYREGLQLIRDTVPRAFLLGCGAPTIASVGLVDAMRVSADTAIYVEPAHGDLSAPGQRSAMLSGQARQWQNGRLWWNDPDCLIARPAVADRRAWAAHVVKVNGLRSVSDRVADLDDWGLATTRAYLDGAGAPYRRD